MDQTGQKKLLNLFYIPPVDQSTQDSSVVSIIDASGSMSSYWKMLARQYNKLIAEVQQAITITFDTNVRVKPEPILSENIQEHGGGCTDITKAFDKLNELFIQNQINSNNVTVIFISDGQDSHSSTLNKRLQELEEKFKKIDFTLKTIHFICIAVGKDFPTFISMKLREIYHSGESTIPPVFLVDTSQSGDKEVLFEEQLQLVKQYLGHNKKVGVEPECFKFPWDTNKCDQFYSKTWVLSEEKQIICYLEQEKKILESVDSPFLQNLIEIAKQWVPVIQLLSLKQNASTEAKAALEILEYHRNRLTAIKQDKKLTFAERVKQIGKQDYEADLTTLVRELRKFADFELLGKLTQEEAAKRLAIGTVVGKYHNVALKYRGLSVEDFKKARETFIAILESGEIDLKKSSQEPSVISMQNQKDVLNEPDFIEGLKYCPSQYDLVQALPLIGFGIFVKRFDGSMLNPWLIQITTIARSHKIIDSISLQQQGNSITLQTGNEKEVINCILPLFDEIDEDMKPILQSKLYQILMTFNAMQNVDTCFETAYAALLGNAFLFLIQQPQSQWRSDLLDMIYKTMKISYLPSKNFRRYIQAMIDSPSLSVVTEHPNITTKCEDGTKALLTLFCGIKQGLSEFSQEFINHVTERIICEQIARLYPNDTKLSSFFEIENKEELQKLDFTNEAEKIVQSYNVNSLIKDFYTIYNLRNDLSLKIANFDMKKDLNLILKLNTKKLYFLQGKYSLETFNSISKFFNGSELTEEKLIQYLFHGSNYSNSYQRGQTQIKIDMEQILNEIKGEKIAELLKNNPLFTKAFDQLKQIYENEFNKCHVNCIFPVSREIMPQLCKSKGYLPTQYQITAYNMVKNACLAQNCPHYLEINPSLSSHLESFTYLVPAFHKSIKLNPKSKPEELFEIIIKGECLDFPMNCHYSPTHLIGEKAIANLNNKKDEKLKYIEENLKFYKEIN